MCMDSSVWKSVVKAAVKDDPNTKLQNAETDMFYTSVFVKYSEYVDTYETLSYASTDVSDSTAIEILDEVNRIKFKHIPRELSESLRCMPLIHRILKQDIPVQRGFVPEYEIRDKSIVVESPEWDRVSLFGMKKDIWQPVGVYEEDGLYYQEFRQFENSDDENPVQKLGEKRLEKLLLSVSVTCPDCGEIEVGLDIDAEMRLWVWECNSCRDLFGSIGSIDSLIEGMNPLENREWIEYQFWRLAIKEVYGPIEIEGIDDQD